MPELPDVEGYRRVLAEHGQGHRVERVTVADAGALVDLTPARLRRALTGRRLAAPRRHGKWLIAPSDGPALLLHFGMTGRLLSCPPGESAAPHDRVAFTLDDGHQLRFRDQRKLQGIRLAPDEAAVAAVLRGQGPDALALDRPALDRLLSGRRARVKAVLTDQSAVAGLGNLLADEILWHARLHPARPAANLDRGEVTRLATALRRVLAASVPEGRVPPRASWLTGRRDRGDATCPRCHGPLRRERIAGRTTAWCPHCQPA